MSDKSSVEQNDSFIGMNVSSDVMELVAKSGRKASIKGGVTRVPIAKVKPGPWQPRKDITEESIKELAESFTFKGQLEPGVVILDDEGTFLIVAGERRYRAALAAGKDTYLAYILDGRVSDYEASELRLRAAMSNLDREDLHWTDEALVIKAIKEETGQSNEELGKLLTRSDTSIWESLKLADLGEERLAKARERDIAKTLLVKVLAEKDEEARSALVDGILKGEIASVKRADKERGKKGKKRKKRFVVKSWVRDMNEGLEELTERKIEGSLREELEGLQRRIAMLLNEPR